jgi:hypothetical protein
MREDTNRIPSDMPTIGEIVVMYIVLCAIRAWLFLAGITYAAFGKVFAIDFGDRWDDRYDW